MHSKLFQGKPREREHRKYYYKHAIHYAFQALPGQAKRTHTPQIFIETCNPLCIPSSSRTSQKITNTINIHTNRQSTMHSALFPDKPKERYVFDGTANFDSLSRHFNLADRLRHSPGPQTPGGPDKENPGPQTLPGKVTK